MPFVPLRPNTTCLSYSKPPTRKRTGPVASRLPGFGVDEALRILSEVKQTLGCRSLPMSTRKVKFLQPPRCRHEEQDQ